jgi:DNA-binding SARP family transcriptional activator
LLWPESEETNARSNLRHALWRLRKAIGEEYFDADKVTIAFKVLEDCELDVFCLEGERIDTEKLDALIKAVSVYGGDLLPGFYESWVVLERERLRSAFEHAVQRLLDLLIERGSWLEVLEWGERWIALGHVPEPAFRALMTAYGALGDSSVARL